MAKKKKDKMAKLVESFNKPKLKNAILNFFYDNPERTYNLQTNSRTTEDQGS